MKKQRMLYIMGIDWEWIYQRPQILAEKLAGDYLLTVIFPRSITKLKLKFPVMSDIEFHILWTLPYQEKNTFIGKLSRILNSKLFKNIERFQYVFIGYPLYARYIPDDYQGNIIYDCMDNYEFLYPDSKRVSRILAQEVSLIKKCTLLTVSSNQLQKKVDAIAGSAKSILIRNGSGTKKVYDINAATVKEKYSLGYIGTIASWFDFSLIENSLELMPNIEYHLVGPLAVKRNYQTRIICHGPVPHEQLWESVKEYDCLIMPFCINEIISSVDPVKLYEYIMFGKCIISIYYPEIERFGDFVYFYRNSKEYITLLTELVKNGFPPKYTKRQRNIFLNANTWDKRYKLLKKELDKTEV